MLLVPAAILCPGKMEWLSDASMAAKKGDSARLALARTRSQSPGRHLAAQATERASRRMNMVHSHRVSSSDADDGAECLQQRAQTPASSAVPRTSVGLYVRAPNRHGMHARFVSPNRSQGLQPFPWRPRSPASRNHRSPQRRGETGRTRTGGGKGIKAYNSLVSRSDSCSSDDAFDGVEIVSAHAQPECSMLAQAPSPAAQLVADEVASKMEGLQLELGACRGSGHGDAGNCIGESRVNMERLPIIQTDLGPVQQRRLRVGDKTPKNHCSSFRRQDNEAQSYTKNRSPLRGKDAEVQRQELLTLVQELESVGVLVVYQNAKDSSDFATCWKDKEPEVSRYSDGTVRPASSGISKRAGGAKVKGMLQGLRDRVRGWM